VRDAVNIARRGTPAVALVTERFWPQGVFVASSVGMPDVPRVEIPHPIAGLPRAAMTEAAARVMPAILAALRDAGGPDGPRAAAR
jgi:hypothetical protein